MYMCAHAVTPLHYYVWVDNRKKKTDFLVSLLTEGEVDDRGGEHNILETVYVTCTQGLEHTHTAEGLVL